MTELIAVVVILHAGGYNYENTQHGSVQRKYSPPGLMVDIGTHKIHVHIIGEDEVTIIMDAGAVINHGLSVVVLNLDSLPVRILSASGSLNGPQGPPLEWNEPLRV